MTRENLIQVIRDNILWYNDCNHMSCHKRTVEKYPEYSYTEFGCGYTYENRVECIPDILEAIDSYIATEGVQ